VRKDVTKRILDFDNGFCKNYFAEILYEADDTSLITSSREQKLDQQQTSDIFRFVRCSSFVNKNNDQLVINRS